MRTCKTSGGNLCTRCCQVIGIAGFPTLLQAIRTGRKNIVDGDKLAKLWKKISKRRAKKINSYVVGRLPNRSGWFVCKNLQETGCKDYGNRPNTCQTFLADESYSSTCPTDSRVFYRTGGD